MLNLVEVGAIALWESLNSVTKENAQGYGSYSICPRQCERVDKSNFYGFLVSSLRLSWCPAGGWEREGKGGFILQ
ncbi:MAG: hypothetical protein AAGD25_40560 [Cyanobacteria bacterium P01_F01_bin.150]